MQLFCSFAIGGDTVRFLLDGRLWPTTFHGTASVLHLLYYYLVVGVSHVVHLLLYTNASPVSDIIDSIRGGYRLVSLAVSSPRLLEDHLLAVKFLYGSYVLSVQVVLILIHAGSIDDVIGLVLGTLRGWSRRQFQTAISADHDVLLSSIWFGTYD
jgi:hypothetical protein